MRRLLRPGTGAPRLHGYALVSSHLQAQNFSRLAFRKNFKGPAADFAIGGELLRLNAGIDDQFRTLATERTLDFFRNLHWRNLNFSRLSAKLAMVNLEPCRKAD